MDVDQKMLSRIKRKYMHITNADVCGSAIGKKAGRVVVIDPEV